MVMLFFHLCCTKIRPTAMIRSLEIGHKSGKSQGILKWKISGNPALTLSLAQDKVLL